MTDKRLKIGENWNNRNRAKYDNCLQDKHLRIYLKSKPNARRGRPSALSIISNEYANLAMTIDERREAVRGNLMKAH